MKKLITLITIFIFISCNINIEPNQSIASATSNGYTYETKTIRGMDYLIAYKTYGTSQTGYDIEFINITLDKLLVEKTKLEIQDLKNKY